MVRSEVVERLMMMSGSDASSCAAECGRAAASRFTEVLSGELARTDGVGASGNLVVPRDVMIAGAPEIFRRLRERRAQSATPGAKTVAESITALANVARVLALTDHPLSLPELNPPRLLLRSDGRSLHADMVGIR